MKQLRERPAEAAYMSRRAAARYEALFTAGKMVQSYVQIYRELVAR
jgi:hypothetical protein